MLRQDPALRAGPLQLEPILAPAHQLPDAGKMGDSVMMDLGGPTGGAAAINWNRTNKAMIRTELVCGYQFRYNCLTVISVFFPKVQHLHLR